MKRVIYPARHDFNGWILFCTDADSEGEEGKFYVWKKDELQTPLKHFDILFAETSMWMILAIGRRELHSAP